MVKNVGGVDRLVRFVVGPVLVLVGVVILAGMFQVAGGFVTAAVAIILGGIITYTAVVRHCKVNQLLGINTAK